MPIQLGCVCWNNPNKLRFLFLSVIPEMKKAGKAPFVSTLPTLYFSGKERFIGLERDVAQDYGCQQPEQGYADSRE